MKPMTPMQPMQPLNFDDFADVTRWWPEVLGTATSAGSQDDVHYAYFRGARRLLIRQGSGIRTYDTGDHDIQGIAQASDMAHVRFVSDRGPVDVSEFKVL
jgi:hypothetical protein